MSNAHTHTHTHTRGFSNEEKKIIARYVRRSENEREVLGRNKN